MKHSNVILPWVAFAALVPVLLTAGCGNGEELADAYGNFEATEVRISAEVGGRLQELTAREGEELAAEAAVGSVETTDLELQRAEVEACRRATASRIAGVDAQVAVLRERRKLAASELQRIESLAADHAATPQQLDRATSELAVVEAQIREAAVQRRTIADEVATLEASLAQIDDRIRRAGIVNPIAGTVLTVFAEPQELVSAGQPLYEIADLSTLELRAFASGSQLPGLALGQPVTVAVDAEGGGERRMPGEISWIAQEAEFTPSTLQTKEERVDLVYAFKVRVTNPNGRLKIGMPGEVYFQSSGGE
ncbi:MAG: HlyD family efflux transporter periplasmic adaptor subunit [Acidobacteriota bacterium]|nr:HlyD family efflux transporter periplasmic adaptor subunit [Acidobacteriota bacterium]